jgi:hypothetical protein
MIVYILTEEQYNSIHLVYYNDVNFFSAGKYLNNTYAIFLSDQDKEEIAVTEWAWILDLPQGEYIPPPAIPFPPVE